MTCDMRVIVAHVTKDCIISLDKKFNKKRSFQVDPYFYRIVKSLCSEIINFL